MIDNLKIDRFCDVLVRDVHRPPRLPSRYAAAMRGENMATTERSALLRRFFARCVATRGGATDPRIEEAFTTVPREPFAGPAPWSVFLSGPWVRGASGPGVYVQTPSDDPAFLYQDTLIALDAARGINIGEPSLHARCLDQLDPQVGDIVLHVGAGSGYYTALLARLVGPHGRVHFAGYWPDKSGPMANSLNRATKCVVTHRPDSLGWGPVQAVGSDIRAGVRRIKEGDGADLIVWGSSTLTPVLLEEGLADEVLLLVFPVMLGSGKRIFSDAASPRELTLVGTKAAASGVLMNTYRPVGPLRTGTVGGPAREGRDPARAGRTFRAGSDV